MQKSIFGHKILYEHAIVYGSITLKFFCGLWTPIRTSDSTAEAKFKKNVFWDTLLYMYDVCMYV